MEKLISAVLNFKTKRNSTGNPIKKRFLDKIKTEFIGIYYYNN